MEFFNISTMQGGELNQMLKNQYKLQKIKIAVMSKNLQDSCTEVISFMAYPT